MYHRSSRLFFSMCMNYTTQFSRVTLFFFQTIEGALQIRMLRTGKINVAKVTRLPKGRGRVWTHDLISISLQMRILRPSVNTNICGVRHLGSNSETGDAEILMQTSVKTWLVSYMHMAVWAMGSGTLNFMPYLCGNPHNIPMS